MQRKDEDEEVCQDQLKPLRNSHALIPVQSPLNKSSFMMGANHTEVSGEYIESVEESNSHKSRSTAAIEALTR